LDTEKIERVRKACIELVDAVMDVYESDGFSNIDMCHARLEWYKHYTLVDEMQSGCEAGDFARAVDDALLIMCGVDMKREK